MPQAKASHPTWIKKAGSESVLDSLKGRELIAADQVLASSAWLARGLGPGDGNQPVAYLGAESSSSGRPSALALVFPGGRWLLGAGPERIWSGLRQLVEPTAFRSILGPVESVAALLGQPSARLPRTGLRVLRQYGGQNLAERGLGRGRSAERTDVSLLTKWYAQQGATLHPATTAQNLVMQKRVWLWEDNGPVAMASHSPPTPFGLRLQDVFVPPEWRRRGYGLSIVAYAASRLSVQGHSPLFLFHIASDPKLESFYDRLNFRTAGLYCELEESELKAIASASIRPGNDLTEDFVSH